MEVRVSADNVSMEKDYAQSLEVFKELPSDKRDTALNNICTFVLGMKIGAQLSEKSDKATA